MFGCIFIYLFTDYSKSDSDDGILEKWGAFENCRSEQAARLMVSNRRRLWTLETPEALPSALPAFWKLGI